MIKTYLRAFGGENVQTYPIEEIRYRSDDGRTLEVVNNFKAYGQEKIKRLRKII